jgi:hypothetical protein
MPKKTLKMATWYCINQEIRFLNIKKANPNEQLYRLHVDAHTSATTHGTSYKTT